jgi:hypothetical protein
VSLTPDNGLKVTPAKALTDELRASIKEHKAELVGYLLNTAANDANEAERELIEERAAIMEYDGGVERPRAERAAKLHTDYLLHHWKCPICCAAGQGRGKRCTVGAGLWELYGAEVTQ